MQRWYVVQTKPNHEQVAALNLRAQNFNCFLPYVKNVSKKSRPSFSALFPSYLFIELDIQKDNWGSIKNTKGVLRLLGASEDTACPVELGFVENLKATIGPQGFFEATKLEKTFKLFEIGQVVQVKEGIFQGFTGTYKQTLKNKALVLLDLLYRKIEVKLSLVTLEATIPPSK